MGSCTRAAGTDGARSRSRCQHHVNQAKASDDGGTFHRKQKPVTTTCISPLLSKQLTLFSAPPPARKLPVSYTPPSVPFLRSRPRCPASCSTAWATRKVHSSLPDPMIRYQNSSFQCVSCLVLRLRECFLGWISCQIKSLW